MGTGWMVSYLGYPYWSFLSFGNGFRAIKYMKNNSNWLDIQEEFRKKWGFLFLNDQLEKVFAHFKPYFQEQRHKEAVEELEVVDNSNTDTNS